MSRGLPSYTLLLIIALIYTVTAAPLNSSGSLDSLVPSCAIQCFDSFLNISYGDQTSRTLAALCPLIGAYGFTIGEAAVQCLVAERAAGACSNQVASNAVIDKAYFMCFGQPSAVLPTHSVITATLAMPLYGTGPITFPAATKTSHQTIPTAISRETQSSISLPTTLVTDTTSLSKPRPSMTGSTAKHTATTTIRRTTRPSTTLFRSSTSSLPEVLTTDPTGLAFTETTTTAAETSTNAPDGIVSGQSEKKASASLSNGQIAGVAIGSIIGVGLIGVGIAIFCRCLRRRRSQFGRKMRKDGRLLRDSWGPEKPNGGGGTDSWIVNQLRAPLDPGPVPTPTKSWYNRASWRPSAIGLAISPARTRDPTRATSPTSARPLSKLLPAKPVMGQGPPRLEVLLPSRDGDSHFGAAAFMSTAAAGAASGAVMSGAMAASSSPKPAPLPKAQPMAQSAAREPTTTKQFAKPRNLTPPRIVIPSPSLASPRSKPQSPLLKLIIPKKGTFKPFVPIPVTNTRHDSSTTEFEEDGRTSLSPGGQIWRPPSADPLSAAPYYVADRNGNWKLGDPRRAQEIAELEASISPLTAAPRSAAPKLVAGLGLASGADEALELVKAASRREATKAAAKIKAAEEASQGGLGIRMAPEKTIRAVKPSFSSDEDIQEQERDQQPYAPRPLFSNNGSSSNAPRRLSSQRRSSTRSLTRPRITSTDSGVTTFSTSTEDDAEMRSPLGMEQLGNLSPVVESPRSLRPRRGQSPTQYPKIPASLNAAVPSSGDLNIEMATSKGGNVAVPSKPAMADRPAQKSPSFGAPLAVGTMSSNDDKTKPQGKRPMGGDAAGAPNAIRTGSPMMRMENPASRPDDRYQGPRNQAYQQPNMPAQPNAYSQPYPSQQGQQYSAPAYQRPTGANNYHMPYRLPPHPSAYRPNIDSSGYPYQTRLPEFNQGPMTYNMPYAPQPNRYPYHNPRDHQPPFAQQPSSGRPMSQLPQQRQQPGQRPQPQPLQPQQQQQQQQPRPQRQQRPPSLGRMPQRQQPQQDFYPQQPSASSRYPSDIPQQGPLLTSTSTSTTSSADSQSSSLLAKRLGNSRAANMALPVPQPITTSSSQNKWLRQGQQGQQQPSTPQMPPPPQQPAELPATPVWKPRLTPTRRGEDLYLIAR